MIVCLLFYGEVELELSSFVYKNAMGGCFGGVWMCIDVWLGQRGVYGVKKG